MKKILTVLAAVLPLVVFGAGSVTITNTTQQSSVHKKEIEWTGSTNDGSCVQSVGNIRGQIMRIRLISSTVGNNVPTNNYDMTLTDQTGYDLLNGAGANLASNVNSQIIPCAPAYPPMSAAITNQIPIVVNDSCTLIITNVSPVIAGNSAMGRVIVYTKE